MTDSQAKRAKTGTTVLNILIRAPEISDEEILRVLQAKLFDVDVQDRHGYTALMLAILHDRLSCVAEIVAQSKDLNLRSKVNKTALMYAAASSPVMTKILVDAGANPHLVIEVDPLLTEAGRPAHGRSALWCAIRDAKKECVRILLQNGCSLDDKYDGTTTYRDLWDGELE